MSDYERAFAEGFRHALDDGTLDHPPLEVETFLTVRGTCPRCHKVFTRAVQEGEDPAQTITKFAADHPCIPRYSPLSSASREFPRCDCGAPPDGIHHPFCALREVRT